MCIINVFQKFSFEEREFRKSNTHRLYKRQKKPRKQMKKTPKVILLTNAENTIDRTYEQEGSLKENRNNKLVYTYNKKQ